MPTLLSKIFPRSEPGSQFDIVAAVVDRIPYPSDAHPLPDVMQGVDHRAGFEGVSVAVSYSDTAAPGLWSRQNDEKGSGTTGALQRPVLSFRFPCEPLAVGAGTAPGPVRSRIWSVVQLPVANTLFHNGQLSTMFATRWARATNPTPQNGYVRTGKINLTQQTLNMTGMLPDDTSKYTTNLVLGLHPITTPRVIASGLGNIIRELYVDGTSKKPMPASMELEIAISQEIKNLQTPDQRPAVWALIIPRESRIDDPEILNHDAAYWIERGGRLHRILSGGGGWGLKKGLLALDPKIDFNSPELETDGAFDNAQTTDGIQEQALEEIFKPGDLITFLLSRHSDKSPLEEFHQTPVPKNRNWCLSPSPSVYFGCTPSTVDLIPDQDTATGKKKPPFDRIFIKRHFGMLSEQGMNIHDEIEVPVDSIQQPGMAVHTKIDNPLAYFSITVKWLGQGSTFYKTPVRPSLFQRGRFKDPGISD